MWSAAPMYNQNHSQVSMPESELVLILYYNKWCNTTSATISDNYVKAAGKLLIAKWNPTHSEPLKPHCNEYT